MHKQRIILNKPNIKLILEMKIKISNKIKVIHRKPGEKKVRKEEKVYAEENGTYEFETKA